MWISFRSTLTQHWSAPRLGCLLLFQRKNRRVSSSIWKPWPATILRKWRTHYDQKTQRTSQRRFLHWLVLLPALGWKQKAHWFFEISQKPETDSYFILKFCNNTRTDFEKFQEPGIRGYNKIKDSPNTAPLGADSGNYVSFCTFHCPIHISGLPILNAFLRNSFM